MGGLNPFKKPKKPDTSALQKQEALLKKQEAEQRKAEQERKRKEEAALNARRGRSGRQSLLTGLETGVTPVDDDKRTSLG